MRGGANAGRKGLSMSRCRTCLNRFTCDGDECHYRHDPYPEETQERWEERETEEDENNQEEGEE